MTAAAPNPLHRSAAWKWTICGLLLLASAINYMDRQTLANAAVRITKEFRLSQEQYGHIEAVFAYAFAAGSIVFGWAADRFSVRWLYAIVLTMWSLAGLATGFAQNGGAKSWRRNHPHPTFSADGQRIYYNVSDGPFTRLMVAERAQ
jgi:MFS family permease